MTDHEAIRSRAREDLVIVDDRGREDVVLWERSGRVAHNTQWVAARDDVPAADLDELALTAAAVYLDAGWAVQYREGTISRAEILNGPTGDRQRELGAALLEERLVKLLAGASLTRAATAVRIATRRDADLIEALVLADASNLDEIGTLGLWRLARRMALEGRGVQAALDTWRTQKEYHFWEARIDNFHFDSVRELARLRLAEYDRFMTELARHHGGDDLAQSA